MHAFINWLGIRIATDPAPYRCKDKKLSLEGYIFIFRKIIFYHSKDIEPDKPVWHCPDNTGVRAQIDLKRLHAVIGMSSKDRCEGKRVVEGRGNVHYP